MTTPGLFAVFAGRAKPTGAQHGPSKSRNYCKRIGAATGRRGTVLMWWVPWGSYRCPPLIADATNERHGRRPRGRLNQRAHREPEACLRLPSAGRHRSWYSGLRIPITSARRSSGKERDIVSRSWRAPAEVEGDRSRSGELGSQVHHTWSIVAWLIDEGKKRKWSAPSSPRGARRCPVVKTRADFASPGGPLARQPP